MEAGLVPSVPPVVEAMLWSTFLGALALGLLTGGVWAWATVGSRRRHDSTESRIDEATVDATIPDLAADGRLAPNDRLPGLGALAIVMCWLSLVVFATFGTKVAPDPGAISPGLLHSENAILALICLAILALMRTRGANWTELGLPDGRWSELARRGFHGYLLAALPTIVGMAVISPLQSEENQHVLLQALGADSGFQLAPAIFLTVMVAAPLSEELMFRGVLQPWLMRVCGRRGGWLLTAALFAAVHGWPAGLALLPLSLILGWAAQRTGDLRAPMLIHALFNGTQLTCMVAMLRLQQISVGT